MLCGIERPERRDLYGATRGYLAREAHVRYFAHVELWAGSALLWEGRVTKIQRAGGVIRGFAAAGYMVALSDNPYLSSSATAMTSGAVIRLAIADAAPVIRIGGGDQFVDPQVEHSPAEFDGMTPEAILDQLTKEGGDSVTWDTAVWRDQTLHLQPRTAPETPHYAIPFDDLVTDWSEDAGALYGSAATRYNDSDTGLETTTAWSTSSTFADRFGVSRSKLLTAGTLTATAAAAFRDSWLGIHDDPEVTARIVRGPERGMERWGGGESPGHLVRAGEWVRVGTEPLLPIVAAQFDGFSRSLDISLGKPSPSAPSQLLKPLQEARNYHVSKRDPLSGGKVRQPVLVTTLIAGLMSAADKAKLDGL